MHVLLKDTAIGAAAIGFMSDTQIAQSADFGTPAHQPDHPGDHADGSGGSGQARSGKLKTGKGSASPCSLSCRLLSRRDR